MDFMSFLILLVVSIAVSAVLHYWFKFYITADTWSFISKVIVGWFGASLGTPIFGKWCAWLSYGDIYVVPAALGAFALLVVAIDVAKICKS